jgi:hypothetical protein
MFYAYPEHDMTNKNASKSLSAKTKTVDIYANFCSFALKRFSKLFNH